MLNLNERLVLLDRLRQLMIGSDPEWQACKKEASVQNAWFTEDFIQTAVNNIATGLLSPRQLAEWVHHYQLPQTTATPKNVGIVMAGNIPLVGFHDFLAVFVSGHRQTIKLSSKDSVLLRFLLQQLETWQPEAAEHFVIEDLIKGCDAYIATGSNNSSNYFKSYFSKYPNIIRKNRSSAAILKGTETTDELSLLADDVHLYFGLGCRNVTKLFVPHAYEFQPLLEAFKKYDYLIENHKYKHNYDYQLTIQILNQKPYLTNGSIILTKNPSIFSPISQLYYENYSYRTEIFERLDPEQIQTIVGTEKIPFGRSQQPGLFDYADGIDTMKFLRQL